MSTTVRRSAAVVLGVLGLGLLASGLWFAGFLGASGTAAFTTTLTGPQTIVVPPNILNRVSVPATVTVQGPAGATVWLGATRPSDARAALGTAPRSEVTAVEVSDWSLRTKATGSGEPVAFARADLWHEQRTAPGTASIDIEQKNAPETVVATTDKAGTSVLTVSFERRAWFVQAVVAALIGVFLLLAGILGWRLDTRREDAAGDATRGRPVPRVPVPLAGRPGHEEGSE